MLRLLLCILLLIPTLTGCMSHSSSQPSKEITISVAASLADAMHDIGKQFTKKTGIKVNLNLASSGSLEQQIEQGAPADLFISASTKYTDQLVSKGLAKKDEVTPLLTNQLVLIVPKNLSKVQSLSDLNKVKRVSIGTPDIVPAGQYAKDALISLHLWKEVEPKIVYAKDVRQVLSYVETGNVDAGLVYRSDALISSKVKVVTTLPETSHKPIVYPCAIIKENANHAAAEKMYHYLQSDSAQQIFKKYGFDPITKEH